MCDIPGYWSHWLFLKFVRDACRRRIVLLSYYLVPDCGATNQSLGKLSCQPLYVMPRNTTGSLPRHFTQSIASIHHYRTPRLHCHLTLRKDCNHAGVGLRCTRAHTHCKTDHLFSFPLLTCPNEAGMPARPTYSHTSIMHELLHIPFLSHAYQHTPVPQAVLSMWPITPVAHHDLMQGHEVSTLMSTNNEAAYSNFTYWVPAPPPPSPHTSGAGSLLDATNSDQPDPIEVCFLVLFIKMYPTT